MPIRADYHNTITRPRPSNTPSTSDPKPAGPRNDKPRVDRRTDNSSFDSPISPGIPGINTRPTVPTTIPTLPTGPVQVKADSVVNGVANYQYMGPGPTGTGKIGLSWDPVTTNQDGTPVTDQIGYKVYCGSGSGQYEVAIDVGNVTQLQVTGLEPGAQYCVATAYVTSQGESPYSNEVSTVIAAP